MEERQDLISRQAALKKLAAYIHLIDKVLGKGTLTDDDCMEAAKSVLGEDELPAAQPERMTNRQWIDFLSAQFDISRTSAKEMLHGMMQWKKEDNFKKLFNGGQDETD